MTENELKDQYRAICQLLSVRQLKPAFDQLEALIVRSGLGEFHDQFTILEQNYKFMLKYTVEGINDPERQRIYDHLFISTFELADHTYENLRMKYSQSVEYQKKRGFTKHFITNYDLFRHELEEYAVQQELKNLLQDTPTQEPRLAREIHLQKLLTLFYHCWFIDRLSPEEVQFLGGLLKESHLPYYERAMVVTALMLSLIRFFDEQKLVLLFTAYEDPNPEISQRALIGLMIGLYAYDQRIPFFKGITGRLQILIEDHRFRSNLQSVILQFIRSKETEKIQRKLQDEIIPEMIKLSPNLRNKLSLESLLGEGLTDDKNPEWQEILKDAPELMGKMEELTEMQLEGADVFLSSFAMLKHFPFFSELANWFFPFTHEHPEIRRNPLHQEGDDDLPFIQLIMHSPMLCNSDKYSFFFSLTNIPPDYQKMVSDSLKGETEQWEELAKDESLLAHDKRAETVINQYMMDLYRFYKIHPQHDGFEDIFAWKFDFHHKTTFAGLLSEDPKIQRSIAEFNFVKNHFEEAAELFKILLVQQDDAELLQKLAYCYQKLGDYKTALHYYLQADLFDHNKQWNLKKIALCYRNLKKPGKALEYYMLAENLEPDNLALHVSIGQCQLELGQSEEALKSYFKVEYLSPGNKKIWRPIGWCSLLVGKIDQAEKYYQRLIDDQPNKYDLFNMGHVQWCLGNRKAALDFYKRSINDPENSEKEFMEAFEEDLPHLILQGVNSDDVPIMLDQLRYFLEE